MSEHAVEGQPAALEVREGEVAPYLPHLHSRKGGNQVLTFGDLTEPQVDQGGPPESGEFVYVDISSVDNKFKRIVAPKTLSTERAPSRARQRLCTGDVLVSMTRPNLNAVAILPPDLDCSIGSTGFHVLRARGGVEPKWLFHAVQSPDFVAAMSALVQGALYPAVRPKDIRAFGLEVPPLAEQHRIVAELETQLTRLDASVTALKRVQANLKRYRASVLKDAGEGRLIESDSDSWKRTTLGELASSIRNGYSHKPDAESGTRIFRISAVRRMQLDTDDVRYLSGSESDYSDFLVSPQDVLFTRYNGSRDFVGVCAVVPADIQPTVYPDKLIRVRLPMNVLLPKMLAILASAGQARAFLESRIRTTAGQSGISGGDLKSVPLGIPSLPEQLRIVAEVERRLSVIEGLEATVDANLQRAERLRQSVLARAFSA